MSRRASLAIAMFALVLAAGVSISCSSAEIDAQALVSELDARVPVACLESRSPSLQVAVVDDGVVVWSRAFGDGAGSGGGGAGSGGGEESGTDLAYMNASAQKMFTAVAVLQLVEDGRIDLDTDVGEYVPFPVRHPGFPDVPVTVRMLLAHRSGLDSLRYQFEWDTASAFSPSYRPPCPEELADLDLEGFLAASFSPDGVNHDEGAWVSRPGADYHYSVSAYPLLRYVVGRVSGDGYEAYVRKNIFGPLGMTHSGFEVGVDGGGQAVPHTRAGDRNVALPLWEGNGSMMRTTAADSALFLAALIEAAAADASAAAGPAAEGAGERGADAGSVILRPESVRLMQHSTSEFRVLFRDSDDLQVSSHGLGLFGFRGGWSGYGGSAPGYQCLARFNVSRGVGYVIFSNVNAILTGSPDEYASARGDLYVVQDALLSVLDPALPIRSRLPEAAVGAVATFILSALLLSWAGRRRRRA